MSNEQIAIIVLIVITVVIVIALALVWRADTRRLANNQRCVSNLKMQQGRHVRPSAAVPSSLNRGPSARAVSNLTTGVLGASASTPSDN